MKWDEDRMPGFCAGVSPALGHKLNCEPLSRTVDANPRTSLSCILQLLQRCMSAAVVDMSGGKHVVEGNCYASSGKASAVCQPSITGIAAKYERPTCRRYKNRIKIEHQMKRQRSPPDCKYNCEMSEVASINLINLRNRRSPYLKPS